MCLPILNSDTDKFYTVHLYSDLRKQKNLIMFKYIFNISEVAPLMMTKQYINHTGLNLGNIHYSEPPS